MSWLIYSTHPSLEQARQTAQALVSDALAACCNILPRMESHYMWEGRVTQADEVVMLSKTSAAQADACIAAIAAQHPYDCPAIVKLPLAGGHDLFLQWVETTAKGRASGA